MNPRISGLDPRISVRILGTIGNFEFPVGIQGLQCGCWDCRHYSVDTRVDSGILMWIIEFHHGS